MTSFLGASLRFVVSLLWGAWSPSSSLLLKFGVIWVVWLWCGACVGGWASFGASDGWRCLVFAFVVDLGAGCGGGGFPDVGPWVGFACTVGCVVARASLYFHLRWSFVFFFCCFGNAPLALFF